MKSLGEQLRWLAEHDKPQLKSLLSQLTEAEAEAIIYDWEGVWARPNQLVDDSWPESVILFMAGRGFGKDFCLNTQILTVNDGFKTIGDLEVGDYVYAWDGTPTKVVNLYHPEPRQLVEFTFSDGEKIVSSVEHDWVTLDRQARRAISKHNDGKIPDDWVNWKHQGLDRWGKPRGEASAKKRTSQEIIDSFRDGTSRNDLNHSIPLAKPLVGEHKKELVEPYYVGLWLGDGISASANAIACGEEDEWWLFENWPGIRKVSNCCYRRPAGSCNFIYDMNLKNNKHIPDFVFNASFDQRLLVLQGLMDSDGHATKSSVEFVSIKRGLAEDVVRLARSLGQKPVISEGDAKIDGRFISKKYRVTWRPCQNINPFMLPRKRNIVKFGCNQEMRNEQRMIVSWKYVDYSPTKCIEVDHKDHLFLVGESLIPTHNTRVGAELVRRKARNPENNITIVAATARDVIDTCVLGDSGLMGVCPPKERPEYEPSKSRVVFPNGCVTSLMSAESPERARGANRSIIWGDEIGSWQDKDMYDQLMLSLRKGESKFYGTTTPRANDIIVHIYRHAVFNNDPPQEGKWARIITGSTYDNMHNLSSAFRDTIVSTYEGTRLGQQELEGMLLLDAEGALWNTTTIVDQTLKDGDEVPELKRVCIGVDPAVSSGKNSDKTGIVVSGLGVDDCGYVLEDHTGKYTPEGWVNKVLSLYDHYSNFCAVSIIVEKNQGGDFIKQSIERARAFLPVDYTFSSRSKIQRAEPIALMYEQGKIFHARTFTDLETEMTNYEGKPRQKSPDHMDAMVFSIYGCMPVKNKVTKGFEFLV